MTRRPPKAVTRGLALLAAWLAVYELDVLLGVFPEHGVVFGRAAHLVISFAAAGVCLAGALNRRGPARAAWALVAVGIAAWNLGDTYWTAVLIDQASIPVPSPADVGYLAFPALVFAAIAVLMRPLIDVSSRLLLVDGLAAGLSVGAAAAALLLGNVFDPDAEGVALNVTYALSDLVLLGLVVGGAAVRGWRFDRMWALMGAGVVAFWIADTSYLVTLADGSYSFPGPADVGWSACFVLLAAAAWQPGGAVAPVTRLGRRVTLLPLGFAALALVVLASAGLGAGSAAAVLMAAASLVLVGVRMLFTFTAHVSMLDVSQREALTDSLTGLGNRRRLVAELPRLAAAATPEDPVVLVLFDLDGFKFYNDSFGHPSGDALLARLAGRLAALEGPDTQAFRMGGDEFCLLARLADRTPEAVVASGVAALTDVGAAFTITASSGAVVLPRDAASAEQALRAADQRMYADKYGGRAAAGRRVPHVVASPPRGQDTRDAGAVAAAVARRLGLGPRESELVGEAAEVVRQSHRPWDGAGSAGGPAGEALPLEARIVAVCDAYDAMRTPGPSGALRSEGEVLAELRRGSGTQFDPRVVEAFCLERSPGVPVLR